MNAPVTQAEWAELRRASMQAMPSALAGKGLPDVLLPYQKDLQRALDISPLVVTEKSRRIGATWGIGADAVLTSGAAQNRRRHGHALSRL